MVEQVLEVLNGNGTTMPKNWNRRFKYNRDKMKTGDIFELAEVVRNLSLREQEKGLSTGEKQMFVKAKKILASELMYAKDMDEDETPGSTMARAPSCLAASATRQRSSSDGERRRPREPASGPCSSPPGAASGWAVTARRRSRRSAAAAPGGEPRPARGRPRGSTRSSSLFPREWEEPAILLAEEMGAGKVTLRAGRIDPRRLGEARRRRGG